MMIKKKHIGYAVVMLAFVLWLIFSNSAVIYLSGVSKLHQLPFDEAFFKDKVYLQLDGIQISGNLTESFGVSGWAFAETWEDNSERYLSVILQGEDVSYEAVCQNYSRRGGSLPDKSRPNDMLGFAMDISTLGMKDGVYDLYIYCKENASNYGVANGDIYGKNVGIRLEKRGGTLTQRFWQGSRLETLRAVTQKGSVAGGLDGVSLETEEGLLLFQGWLFTEDRNCDSQTLYIELRDEDGEAAQYTTTKTLRVDVANVYNDPQLEYCGYWTSIPAQDVADGDYTVRILLEDRGEIWSSGAYRLTKTGDTLKTQPLAEEDLSAYVGSVVAAPALSQKEPAAGGIDSAEIKQAQEFLDIQGWVLAQGHDCDLQNVYVELLSPKGELRQYTAHQVTRMDVAQAYGSTQYENCGFRTCIPIQDIAEEAYVIRILLENGGEVWASPSSTLVHAQGDVRLQPVEEAVYSEDFVSTLAEPLPDFREESIAGGIDSIELDEQGFLDIEGWVLVEGRRSDLQTAYLEWIDARGGSRVYTTQVVIREDVADAYGNLDYLKCGYHMRVPLENIADGAYTLQVLLENGGEAWRSLPYQLTKTGNKVQWLG